MRLGVAVGALVVGLIPVQLGAGEATSPVEVREELGPFPKFAKDSPEGARILLDWLVKLERDTWREDGSHCGGFNMFRFPALFPRTDPIDAVFEEYRSKGRALGAIASFRLDSLEDQLQLLESEDPCVSKFAVSVLGYRFGELAKAEGTEAEPESIPAIREVVSAQGTKRQYFDDAKPPVLWRDLAVVESQSDSKGIRHILRRDGDGWKYLGYVVLWVS